MKEIIRLENVIKMISPGRRTVNDISMSVPEKQRIAVFGAPGSGKSTLMRLIAGMEKPSEGKIVVMNKNIHEMNTDNASVFRNENIGFIQKDPGFLESLNIFENVTLPLLIRGMALPLRKQAAREQFKALGISHIAQAYPSQLTVYEAVMASVARAMITQPKIMLLNDITAGLSARETIQITGIIHALWKFGDYTVIGFSGAKSAAIRADRYIQLGYGTILEDIS